MYNHEQKTRFIKDYTGSLNTAQVARVIFDEFEQYEREEWGADLCTRTSDELQPVIDEIAGVRSRTKWMALTILKEYVKWCLLMNIPGTCDGMLHVENAALEKIRHRMVSSPLHLQYYMDKIMEPEDKETIDNIYRCYLWMAYGGIDEADTLLVKNEDVDFFNMIIHCKNTNAPIYREALSAFHNVVSLTSFLYEHPKYTKPIRRDRVPGDTILRGIKSSTNIYTVRTLISKRTLKATQDGTTDMQLSFQRVRMSGLFYRVYEMERAGIPPNFSEATLRFMAGKTYSFHGREKVQHKQNKIENDYMEDYQRWKLVFSV